MTFTVSAVLLFGLASVIAVKTKATGASAAVLLFLLGFFVAGTDADEPIRNLVHSFADFATELGN